MEGDIYDRQHSGEGWQGGISGKLGPQYVNCTVHCTVYIVIITIIITADTVQTCRLINEQKSKMMEYVMNTEYLILCNYVISLKR